MALYFDLIRLPSFWLNPTFEVDTIPKAIADFQRHKNRERSQSCNSFNSNSSDDIECMGPIQRSATCKTTGPSGENKNSKDNVENN